MVMTMMRSSPYAMRLGSGMPVVSMLHNPVSMKSLAWAIRLFVFTLEVQMVNNDKGMEF